MTEKFRVAFRGLIAAVKDKSILLQLVLGIITIIVFVLIKIDYFEWMIVLILIGGVVTTEILNTCIERLCDLYSEGYNEKIRYIKDLSSAAVLFFCIIAAVVAFIIIINKFGG